MARRAARGYCRPVRLRPPTPSRTDASLAAALLAFFLAEVVLEARFDGDRPVSAIAALAMCGSLLWRRDAPLLAVGAGVGVIVLSNAAAPALGETGAFLLAFVVALYSLGRHARGRAAHHGGLLLAAAVPLAAIEPGEDFLVGDLAYIALIFAGPWLAGLVLRRRNEQEQALEARAATLAVADERARIARELHDVVSHAISLIVLQARGGRRMLDTQPGQTREALDAIEHAGAQALEEMRRMLGLLRDRGDDVALAPRPSLRDLDDVVARVRATGLQVDVDVRGEPVELPPGIDISAYRIVQEALTNALKHAGPAHAQLLVRYTPDAVEVEVVDDGAGNGDGGGSGLGLAGLRERVAVYGGVLEAGARPQGGYALRARLPLGTPR
jgi:signal transduction histidine kinase